jgi:hypothetical protein
MCTYNGERFVGEQLESIAAQTLAPAELVVCDDRSTDRTAEVVLEFAARAPFPVRLHVNERNLGSTKNFERAISLCEGDLIALSDQDDVWAGRKLEKLAAAFASDARVGLVFSDAELVDEELRPLGARLWEKVGFDEKRRRRVRAGRALDVLLPGGSVTGATAAFRAWLRPLALEIPDDLRVIHDGWIAMVAAAVSRVVFVEEPLVRYRQHSGQQIGAPEEFCDTGGAQSLGDIPGALARENPYDELAKIALRLRERLEERGAGFDCGAALRRIEDRVEHLRARASMPQGRLRRAGVVARELFARRYHLYSNGFYSAAKDLLA